MKQPASIALSVAVIALSSAQGKQLYGQYCVSCHGANGQGGPGNDLIPAAPSLVDDMWDHGSTDGEIFENIKEGIGPKFDMKAMKAKMKDEDIWNVINYLRSLGPKK